MADNVQANSGSGGATFATDAIGSAPEVHYPINKPAYGALNSVTIVDKAVGSGFPIEAIPGTTAGLTQYSLISAASANATNVKASAGKVYLIHAHNTSAGLIYLKLYDSASAPTPGSGTPVKRIPIPANNAIALGWSTGIGFSSGIGFVLVTGQADGNSTAVAAGDVVLNIDYA